VLTQLIFVILLHKTIVISQEVPKTVFTCSVIMVKGSTVSKATMPVIYCNCTKKSSEM